MKCKVPKMSKKEIAELKSRLEDDFKKSCRQYIKDMEMQAGCRAQWMLMVSLIRNKGYGKKRLYDLWREIDTILEELSIYAQTGVLDEMLISTLEQVGFDVHGCYGEYFEIADRLKKCSHDVSEYERLYFNEKDGKEG